MICRRLPRSAARHNLWFHVDGAFGALLRLTKDYANLVRGIEQADSLAFDLHKWVYLPFEIGCVLVRDPKLHTATFATHASYLEEAQGGIMAGGLPFADRGVELTRGFRALKLWMSLQVHGVETYGRLIAQNMAQAAYLEELIHTSIDLAAGVGCPSTNQRCVLSLSASRNRRQSIECAEPPPRD